MRNVQGLILVALAIIALLLYNINKKLGVPKAPAEATQVAAVAPPQTVTAVPAVTVPASPAPSPLGPAVYTAQPRVERTVRRTPSPPVTRQVVLAQQPAVQQPPVEQASPYGTSPYGTVARPPAPAPEPYNSVRPYVPEAPAPAPAPAPSPVRTLTVPAGTAISVRLLDHINSEKNRTGDVFQATLEEPLVADGVVVAPRNSTVMGRVVQARQSGRVAGVAEMALELDRISTVGGEVQIASDTMMRQAPTSHGKDVATLGAMAGIGAAIGAIAGGRKGAGIGAAAGGAAGGGTVMATKGKPVDFPPETHLTFRLRAPLTVTADNGHLQTASEDQDRPRLIRRN